MANRRKVLERLQYACADQEAFVLKPRNITFEEAASIPLAGTTALQALHKGQAAPGKKLTPQGRYLSVGGSLSQMFQGIFAGPVLSRKNGRQFGFLSAITKLADLETLSDLAAAGKIKPVIDRTYTLADVPEASVILKKDMPGEKSS